MSTENLTLRPEVLAFARLMEQRLREKDADKGQSWKDKSEANLVVHAVSKAISLEGLVRSMHLERHRVAVDLANYCMMIADVSGALETPCECRITNLDGHCVECGKEIE